MLADLRLACRPDDDAALAHEAAMHPREFCEKQQQMLTAAEQQPFPIVAQSAASRSQLRTRDDAGANASASPSPCPSPSPSPRPGRESRPGGNNDTADELRAAAPDDCATECGAASPQAGASSPLLAWFERGLFADVTLAVAGRGSARASFAAHRLVLCQSPFFERLLVDGCGAAAPLPANRVVELDFDGHPLVTAGAVAFVLRALYAFDVSAAALAALASEHQMAVLAVACYFELEYVAARAFHCLLRQAHPSSATHLARLTDALVHPARDASAAQRPEAYALLSAYHAHLKQAYLAYMCQLVGSPRADLQLSAGQLAALPWPWLQHVLGSDLLVVGSEYARYTLLKDVVRARLRVDDELFEEPQRREAHRWDAPRDAVRAAAAVPLPPSPSGASQTTNGASLASDGSASDDDSDDATSSDGELAETQKENAVVHASSPTFKLVGSVLGSLVHAFTGSSGASTGRDSPRRTGKRPASSSNPAGIWGMSSPAKHRRLDSGSVAGEPADAAARRVLTRVERLFRDAIVYTFMSFPDLETIKADRFIPERLVVENFWLQQELTHSWRAGGKDAVHRFPPFRFAARFANVRKRLWLDGALARLDAADADATAVAPLLAEPVDCAGFRFRVALHVMPDREAAAWAAARPAAAPAAPPLSPAAVAARVRSPRRPGRRKGPPAGPSSDAGPATVVADGRDAPPPTLRAQRDQQTFHRVFLRAELRVERADASAAPETPSYSAYAFQSALLDPGPAPADAASLRGLEWLAYGEPIVRCVRNGVPAETPFALASRVQLVPADSSGANRRSANRALSVRDVQDDLAIVVHVSF